MKMKQSQQKVVSVSILLMMRVWQREEVGQATEGIQTITDPRTAEGGGRQRVTTNSNRV